MCSVEVREENCSDTAILRKLSRLRGLTSPREVKVTDLCTNSTAGLSQSSYLSMNSGRAYRLDKIVDNDDKYDVQSYMRSINTTGIALLDNFK